LLDVLVATKNIRGEHFPVAAEILSYFEVTIAAARAAGFTGPLAYEPDSTKAPDPLLVRSLLGSESN
jgi:hypothetical protein